MKRLLLLFVGIVAAFLMALPAKGQTAQNITPHDQQPIQPVIVTVDPTGTCANYALTYINWKTGAQTVCANGTYLTSTSGGGGGMVYPAAGIPLSAGTAWSGSITAPNGAIVGTTDTQTLTNKTVNGVPPAIFGYLDATSSIQAQINARLTGVGIQQNGSAVGTAQILNFSTNLNATVAGGIATITATGGGGAAGPQGYFATAASNSSTLTVGTDCTTGTPCMSGVGSLTLAKITASMTVTASTGSGTNDTAYLYFDPNNGNALTIGDGGTVTLTTPGSGAGSGIIVNGSAITGFPVDSLPLFTITITSDNFTVVSDQRALYRAGKRIIAGSNVTVTDTSTGVTIASTGGSSFNGGTITNDLVVSTADVAPITATSSSTAATAINVNNTSSGGHAWALSSLGGSQSHPGSFQWYDNTSNIVGMRLDGRITVFDNLQLGGANGDYTPGSCDRDGKVAWDTTTTPHKMEICDGTAWHHVQFSD